MIHSSPLLRCALLADAVFSGVSAVAMVLDTSTLASLLGLPDALLRETGLFLIAYTALVGWLGLRASDPRPGDRHRRVRRAAICRIAQE